MTPESRCSQSRSSASEAVPSLSTRLLPLLVARSARDTCRYRVPRDPFSAGRAPTPWPSPCRSPLPVARSRARCGCASIPSAEARRTSWSRVSPSRPSSPARSVTVPSRSRASRVSSRAVTRVVAVDSRWSSQTPRCSRAVCSTAAAWSGSQRSRASCSTGPRTGSRFDRAVTARCRSTNATASRESWVVARATWRAFHACSRPSCTKRPERREPVAELDRLGDQRRARGVREVQGGGELLDGVLGHRRRPGPGQRGPVEERRTQRGRQATGALGRERGRRVSVGGRVQVDPVHRQRQQPGLLRVRRPTGGHHRVQHRRRVQVPHVGCGLASRRAGCWSCQET